MPDGHCAATPQVTAVDGQFGTTCVHPMTRDLEKGRDALAVLLG
jgi:hypothetical protein